MARPRIEIDWKQFDKLCADQCTLEDISEELGCSEDTIERACKREKKLSFADYYDKKRRRGFVSLRRTQFALALAGDKTMLIWLGKQYLGQREPERLSEEPGRIIEPFIISIPTLNKQLVVANDPIQAKEISEKTVLE